MATHEPEALANIDISVIHAKSQIVKSINLSLTEELRAFVDQNSGDRSLYATRSEFLRAVLREKKERMEAAELRDGIVEGYRDLIEGRVVEFKGNLCRATREGKRRRYTATAALEKKLREARRSRELDCPPDFFTEHLDE